MTLMTSLLIVHTGRVRTGAREAYFLGIGSTKLPKTQTFQRGREFHSANRGVMDKIIIFRQF